MTNNSNSKFNINIAIAICCHPLANIIMYVRRERHVFTTNKVLKFRAIMVFFIGWPLGNWNCKKSLGIFLLLYFSFKTSLERSSTSAHLVSMSSVMRPSVLSCVMRRNLRLPIEAWWRVFVFFDRKRRWRKKNKLRCFGVYWSFFNEFLLYKISSIRKKRIISKIEVIFFGKKSN